MLSGFKNRHVPSGVLLAQLHETPDAAVAFMVEQAPRTANQYEPESVTQPCSCGQGFAPICPMCKGKMSLAECDAQFCSRCKDHAIGEWCCVECGAKEPTQ